ncbi:hypothetical protein GN958_ATG18392 [Phytophthora infestans]|uniref:Uncharacterized protein n=1 Tax=Phytophthora infestans TaxID=4787 RepID=A0A8S9TY12_PHYIN|nr:hypothetical protein GN958_ATG18392 [Phytophthora infestans]
MPACRTCFSHLYRSPFLSALLSERGRVIAAWNPVAATHVDDSGFPRHKRSGKYAQARFNKLAQRKRDANTKVMVASRVAEETTEVDTIIDTAKRKRDDDEEASRNVCCLAMKRICEERTPPRKRKEEK